jgi:hypothetical protein
MGAIWYIRLIGLISTVTGPLILLLEYPFPGIEVLGPVYKNLFARGFIYVALATPGFWSTPSVTGTLCLLVTGIVYMLAWYSKEEWQHPSTWLEAPRKDPKTNNSRDKVVMIEIDDFDREIARKAPRHLAKAHTSQSKTPSVPRSPPMQQNTRPPLSPLPQISGDAQSRGPPSPLLYDRTYAHDRLNGKTPKPQQGRVIR